ncbi:hypothetical protein Pint_30763 [Pistacia integerrima]|uniref:Uncharacterized protein n=1 Tax=Pistacia integerrima TaxID=434235 RepID=A0ACC0X1B2_9ROSI|nr:hypothetical protein Pint_30763 [Pistacia integerrima]
MISKLPMKSTVEMITGHIIYITHFLGFILYCFL